MTLHIPPQRKKIVVVTGMMLDVINRTMAITPHGGIAVWSGLARLGKTTTARHLKNNLVAAYEAGEADAFRAEHYEVGTIASGNEEKKGIKSLYEGILKTPLDPGVYHYHSSEYLAELLVHALRIRNIRLLLVDEAGRLSSKAIEGMIIVRDVAELQDWMLSIVFIGMNDLPQKVQSSPQVRGRIHEWCCFHEYNLEETWKLLRELHPHFEKLDPLNDKHKQQVEYIHRTYGGVPGLIIQFLQKLDYRLKNHEGDVTVKFLRAIHLLTVREKNNVVRAREQDYAVNRDEEKEKPAA